MLHIFSSPCRFPQFGSNFIDSLWDAICVNVYLRHINKQCRWRWACLNSPHLPNKSYYDTFGQLRNIGAGKSELEMVGACQPSI